ncbi:S-adenosyl-L-methionine-dependent methyltransferase [Pluteus cervinus]|uniref:S-adenosyl-L-methionine-dependent methyltransferase n=1 Tax=Pluteus cervinus TaxID=181527 RepID=A0ACD3B5N1_9AGAR|nr:S-adenosyl-L-methionine-dependent methyltransferase [Pluteus cervinus]
MPALVLSPPARDDTVVIDATAAPGNKTSHLSALMGNRGKVYAFERDRKRFSTLTMMLSRAGCTNVEPCNADFLAIDPADPRFSKVTHILVDPSCSGSGIVNRLDHLLENGSDDQEAQQDRLRKLAAFQLMMIKHAMKFPRAQKIVYSTCSVHATENEHVVRAALNSDEGLTRGFKLAPPHLVLPKWDRRGIPNELNNPDDAASLVRCLPTDGTNGFFVSCFLKLPKNEDKRKRAEGSPDRGLDTPEHLLTRKRKKKKLNQPSDSRILFEAGFMTYTEAKDRGV